RAKCPGNERAGERESERCAEPQLHRCYANILRCRCLLNIPHDLIDDFARYNAAGCQLHAFTPVFASADTILHDSDDKIRVERTDTESFGDVDQTSTTLGSKNRR